jgi:SAM-dependent methyltransferase
MPAKTSASLPLVAYADALAAQARVLLVGDARSLLPKALLERGARLVHVCDSDPARLAEAQARTSERSISFGRLDDGPAALRDSFFDLVLVENLANEPEPKLALAAVSRLLAPRGVALIAAPNPEASRPLLASASSPHALDYYTLYDATTAAFPEVRMLGQVPFVGYALVDFSAEGEPSPVLDASLVPPRGEEPDYFVALAARQRRTLEQYAVIQLPLADVAAMSSALAPKSAEPVREVTPSPVERSAAPATLLLEQRLQKQEHWITELEARASIADERADAADERAEAVETRAEAAESRAAEFEARVAEANARLRAAEKAVNELKTQAAEQEEQRRRQHDEFNRERDALKAERATLRAERDALKPERDALKPERDALKAERDALKAEHDTLKAERDALKAEHDALKAEQNALRAELAPQRAELSRSHSRIAELDALIAARDAELAESSNEEEAARELGNLELQLRERGEYITGLERSLFEAERVGRELVRKLRDATLPSKSVELSTQLAEAEAEIATLRWSLALSSSQHGSSHSPPQN